MAKLVHYPWRCGYPENLWSPELRIPKPGTIAPGLGAFDLCGEGWEELPGPTIREGLGQIKCRAGGRDIFYDPECVFQFQRESPDSFSRCFHFALTDSFIHLSNLLYEKHRRNNGMFAELPLSVACRDSQNYLAQEHDFASESLIVEIARNCQSMIESIVMAPRLMLYRRHAEVSIDRLQELDEYSLRSLAHRPGRTIAGKAGSKQRLTGVVRLETPDTYENRVVCDFIRRSDRVSIQYAREMCGRCPRRGECKTCDPSAEGERCVSARVKAVFAYHRKCLGWLRNENLSPVAKLMQPAAKVNYVLQQNPRYVSVWRYYQRLLRQENIEEDVWCWGRRSWADYLRLVMMTTWESRLKGESLVELSRRPLMIRAGNDRGAWFCTDPYEEALVYANPATGKCETVYLLNMQETIALTNLEFIRDLNFDFCWVALREKRDHLIMPFWGVGCTPSQSDAEGQQDGLIAQEIDRLVKRFNSIRDIKDSGFRIAKGVVVIPSERDDVVGVGYGCVWKCVPFRPNFDFVATEVKGLLK